MAWSKRSKNSEMEQKFREQNKQQRRLNNQYMQKVARLTTTDNKLGNPWRLPVINVHRQGFIFISKERPNTTSGTRSTSYNNSKTMMRNANTSKNMRKVNKHSNILVENKENVQIIIHDMKYARKVRYRDGVLSKLSEIKENIDETSCEDFKNMQTGKNHIESALKFARSVENLQNQGLSKHNMESMQSKGVNKTNLCLTINNYMENSLDNSESDITINHISSADTLNKKEMSFIDFEQNLRTKSSDLEPLCSVTDVLEDKSKCSSLITLNSMVDVNMQTSRTSVNTSGRTIDVEDTLETAENFDVSVFYKNDKLMGDITPNLDNTPIKYSDYLEQVKRKEECEASSLQASNSNEGTSKVTVSVERTINKSCDKDIHAKTVENLDIVKLIAKNKKNRFFKNSAIMRKIRDYEGSILSEKKQNLQAKNKGIMQIIKDYEESTSLHHVVKQRKINEHFGSTQNTEECSKNAPITHNIEDFQKENVQPPCDTIQKSNDDIGLQKTQVKSKINTMQRLNSSICKMESTLKSSSYHMENVVKLIESLKSTQNMTNHTENTLKPLGNIGNIQIIADSIDTTVVFKGDIQNIQDNIETTQTNTKILKNLQSPRNGLTQMLNKTRNLQMTLEETKGDTNNTIKTTGNVKNTKEIIDSTNICKQEDIKIVTQSNHSNSINTQNLIEDKSMPIIQEGTDVKQIVATVFENLLQIIINRDNKEENKIGDSKKTVFMSEGNVGKINSMADYIEAIKMIRDQIIENTNLRQTSLTKPPLIENIKDIETNSDSSVNREMFKSYIENIGTTKNIAKEIKNITEKHDDIKKSMQIFEENIEIAEELSDKVETEAIVESIQTISENIEYLLNTIKKVAHVQNFPDVLDEIQSNQNQVKKWLKTKGNVENSQTNLDNLRNFDNPDDSSVSVKTVTPQKNKKILTNYRNNENIHETLDIVAKVKKITEDVQNMHKKMTEDFLNNASKTSYNMQKIGAHVYPPLKTLSDVKSSQRITEQLEIYYNQGTDTEETKDVKENIIEINNDMQNLQLIAEKIDLDVSKNTENTQTLIERVENALKTASAVTSLGITELVLDNTSNFKQPSNDVKTPMNIKDSIRDTVKNTLEVKDNIENIQNITYNVKVMQSTRDKMGNLSNQSKTTHTEIEENTLNNNDITKCTYKPANDTNNNNSNIIDNMQNKQQSTMKPKVITEDTKFTIEHKQMPLDTTVDKQIVKSTNLNTLNAPSNVRNTILGSSYDNNTLNRPKSSDTSRNVLNRNLRAQEDFFRRYNANLNTTPRRTYQKFGYKQVTKVEPASHIEIIEPETKVQETQTLDVVRHRACATYPEHCNEQITCQIETSSSMQEFDFPLTSVKQTNAQVATEPHKSNYKYVPYRNYMGARVWNIPKLPINRGPTFPFTWNNKRIGRK